MNDGAPTLLGSSRDRPPHFAGRRKELDALSGHLQYIRQTGDVSGGMVLVEGVPGVGKTQLVDEFARRAVASAVPDAAVAWLGLSTASIRDEFTLFSRMVAALGRREAEAEQIAGLGSRTSAAALAGARIDLERAPRQAPSLEHMLVRSRAKGLWNGLVMVFTVDEIQNVAAEERRVLRQLHEGRHGCPIMIVGAGLQHAAERLGGELKRADGTSDTAGISRFARRLALGALSRRETLEAITQGLASLGREIDASAAEALAAASLDFPQHVHGYMEGALKAIAQHGRLDSKAALQDALAHGDAARTRYYEERLEGMERPESMATLAEAMRRARREQLSWAEAAELLGGAADGERVLHDAVARGVLTKGALRELSFGLPSFRSYAIERGGHRR